MNKIRRLLLCILAAGLFLAPLALHAGVGDAKRQDRLPPSPIVSPALDAGEIAPCSIRIVTLEPLTATTALAFGPSALSSPAPRSDARGISPPARSGDRRSRPPAPS